MTYPPKNMAAPPLNAPWYPPAHTPRPSQSSEHLMQPYKTTQFTLCSAPSEVMIGYNAYCSGADKCILFLCLDLIFVFLHRWQKNTLLYFSIVNEYLSDSSMQTCYMTSHWDSVFVLLSIRTVFVSMLPWVTWGGDEHVMLCTFQCVAPCMF